jgi:hypothetical protein
MTNPAAIAAIPPGERRHALKLEKVKVKGMTAGAVKVGNILRSLVAAWARCKSVTNESSPANDAAILKMVVA